VRTALVRESWCIVGLVVGLQLRSVLGSQDSEPDGGLGVRDGRMMMMTNSWDLCSLAEVLVLLRRSIY